MGARISENERRRLFGQPCDRPAYVVVATPWGLNVVCHPIIASRFALACDTAHCATDWQPRRIDSYACRTVRGAASTSLHGYALAWDFFDKKYPEPVDVWGPTNAPPVEFLRVFADLGFFPGADFQTRKDWPHIEWAAGLPAPLVIAPTAPEVHGMPNDPTLPDIDGPVKFEFFRDPATGRAIGYYVYSERTGVIHGWGPGAPYLGRSEVLPSTP